MTSLILHIGPPKCGSSSIQQFFASQKRPCVQNTHYIMLDPLEISELNHEEPSESILTTFTQLVVDHRTGCDVLILSHEYLFACRYAIKNICNLAKNLVTNISIIGYSRRQSEFLISAYSQWGFRSPDIIKAATLVLDTFELEPVLFSGLEQRLIASIINDFDVPKDRKYKNFDWYHSYKEIRQLTQASGAVVKCGVLPKKESDTPLLQDFCEKSGLTLHDEMKDASQRVFNRSFDQDVIEAVNNAVAFGLDIPGLNESNQALVLLSTKMVKLKDNSSEFLSNLKSYIDTYFFSSNQQFCQEYGLRETYFAPHVRFSKQEILDLIIHENQQRALNTSIVINNYRMLSARMIELCFKLIKENSHKRNTMPAQIDPKPKILRTLSKLFKR
jgi:hypothetical protein